MRVYVWPESGKILRMEFPIIGFIGQGFIGGAYADDIESRGFPVVRYALEEPYVRNKEQLLQCSIVFIAVPTPTTVHGFDYSIVRDVIGFTKPGAIVVIKSTIIPGTTESLQELFPDRIILHSPEFLREATAASDAAHPERTIIGIPRNTQEYRDAAQQVLAILPKAPFELVCSSREAEYIKYANNSFLFWKVLFANIFANAVAQEGGDWDVVRSALGADSRIGPSHLAVDHTSNHSATKTGRGAGGLCFIKDFAAFVDHYEKIMPSDAAGIAVLRALESKNKELLIQSGKDLDLLKDLYGEIT